MQLVEPYVQHRGEIIAMALEGKSTAEIGAKFGFPAATIRNWLKRDEYVEDIKQYYDMLNEEMLRIPVTNRANRMRQLQSLLDGIQIIIDERSETYSHTKVGGRSGLIVKRHKSIGTGPNAYEVAEYEFDSGLVGRILDIHKQVAVEQGQWQEKKDHNITVTERIQVIKFERQERVDVHSLDSVNPIDAEFSDSGESGEG